MGREKKHQNEKQLKGRQREREFSPGERLTSSLHTLKLDIQHNAVFTKPCDVHLNGTEQAALLLKNTEVKM